MHTEGVQEPTPPAPGPEAGTAADGIVLAMGAVSMTAEQGGAGGERAEAGVITFFAQEGEALEVCVCVRVRACVFVCRDHVCWHLKCVVR